MFNSQKIIELLEANRFKQKDLLDYLGVKENGSIGRLLRSDIKASKLETIADFFGVSIDTFFVRDGKIDNSGVIIAGDKNKTTDINVGSASSRAREYQAKCKSLENELRTKDDLLAERNRTIKLLEEMVSMLRSQLKIAQGQISDK